jgi:Domain of unknown function (DUF1905)
VDIASEQLPQPLDVTFPEGVEESLGEFLALPAIRATMVDIGRGQPRVTVSARGARMESYEFSAELWIWDARKEDGWTFLSVPTEESEEIRAYSASQPRAGFGSVRVSVTIGGSTWQTSVFPGEDGNYALPIKKSIRLAEGIVAGDVVTVKLRTIER